MNKDEIEIFNLKLLKHLEAKRQEARNKTRDKVNGITFPELMEMLTRPH